MNTRILPFRQKRKEKKSTVMLSKFKHRKHKQQLAQMPTLSQSVDHIETLYCPKVFRSTLLQLITQATRRICLVALYLEKDEAGQAVLSALYQAKKRHPELDICVLVDWHRAQRGRIGVKTESNNADWYREMAEKNSDVFLPVCGVPVNTREALGVMHLKGTIIDNTVIYSGAGINNVYLHQGDKYRYDRYQLIKNAQLAGIMLDYLKKHILSSHAVQLLNTGENRKISEIKNQVQRFRLSLRQARYAVSENMPYASHDGLSVTPLVGLGKKNMLNKTIENLLSSTQEELRICTPYFNLPCSIKRHITRLLKEGKKVQIIVGDKTANDFYTPPDQPFKMISTLPYLYEINLGRFLKRMQPYLDKGNLVVRLWKHEDHSFHIKGIWVDNQWQLLTGNNLNLRAWHFDLENAILIQDPKQELGQQRMKELACIQKHTKVVNHHLELDSIQQYPLKVRTLIRRLCRIRIDRLINRIL